MEAAMKGMLDPEYEEKVIMVLMFQKYSKPVMEKVSDAADACSKKLDEMTKEKQILNLLFILNLRLAVMSLIQNYV